MFEDSIDLVLQLLLEAEWSGGAVRNNPLFFLDSNKIEQRLTNCQLHWLPLIFRFQGFCAPWRSHSLDPLPTESGELL